MRALKTILIILLALVAILVILGLMGPNDYRVERSAVINGTPDKIYPWVSSLTRMKDWGPWQAMDKDQVGSMEGTDGTVGAIWKWEGDTVGKGMQEITALEPGKSVRTKLTFSVPVIGDMVSTATMDLEPKGDSTRVIWGMEGENGFWGKLMSKFSDREAMLGPMFETGLANLKGMVEAEATAAKEKSAPSMEIASMDRPATLYFGERRRVKWSELKAFYAENLMKSMGIIQKAGVQPIGAPSGVYFEWDEKNQEADLLAGIPVPSDAKGKLKGMTFYETPASKAYQIAYYGGYMGVGKAHEAMDARMKTDKVSMNANVVEEYVTDPGAEPDSTKWLTNVIYLIK